MVIRFCPDREWLTTALMPVTQFLQSPCVQFLVWTALGANGFYAHIKGVYFHNEWLRGIWVEKDGADVNSCNVKSF